MPSSSLANENFAHPLDSLSAPSPTSYSYVTSPAVVHPQHPSSLVSKAATYLTLSETRRRMTACSTQPLQKALSQRPVIRVLALPLLLVLRRLLRLLLHLPPHLLQKLMEALQLGPRRPVLPPAATRTLTELRPTLREALSLEIQLPPRTRRCH